MTVSPGRWGAHIDGDFVVLLIGMRINRPLKLHRWLPVFVAMPKMIRELEQRPDSGFLGATQGLMTVGPTLIQYWRSFEHPERYARDPGSSHFPAWKAFNQQVRSSGDVGIWHETYRVRNGEYESVYGNMPRTGLAIAGTHMPLGSTSTAARRLGNRADDQAPVQAY